MSDDRFTQTTLRAPLVDQDQAIATYQSGAHLLNYAYPAQHSGNASIDALLPDYNGFSTWNTAGAGTIILYSFMDATMHYLDTASYSDATNATTRGVYDADILELSDAQKNAIRMGLAEWARYIDVEFVEVTESNSEVGLLRFGGTTNSVASGYAWAYYPNWYYAAGGDTWFSPTMMRKNDWSQGTYEYLTIYVSKIAYLGVCGSADFCSNAAHYAFTSTGSIPDSTTATGRVLGAIFGPNGENAGALLDASNANTVEFRGDFIARRTP